MAKFSERYGHVPVRSVLQTNDIDDGLKNRLWNLIRDTFFYTAPRFHGATTDYLPGQNAEFIFKDLWHGFFKLATDSIGTSYFDAMTKLKQQFMSCKWYEVYDLLEFLGDAKHPNVVGQSFMNSVNSVLKEELSGYRFVSGRVVQITSEEEIAAIEQALSIPDSLKPVREHLSQSLILLSDRKQPDYRNSIKESISAVESLSKIITKQNKATLGPALNGVEKQTKMHSVLKEAFERSRPAADASREVSGAVVA